MKLEHYNPEKFKNELKNIILSEGLEKSYKVFIFGSRVNNTSNQRSDIDVGIMGKTEVPPQKLHNIQKKIAKLNILYKIDLVDFAKTSKTFQKEALTKTETII